MGLPEQSTRGVLDVLGTVCHTLAMVVSYTVVPRGRGYWIEVTDSHGSRRSIERFDTEDKAVQRLRVLQGEVQTAERKRTFLRPRQRP